MVIHFQTKIKKTHHYLITVHSQDFNWNNIVLCFGHHQGAAIPQSHIWSHRLEWETKEREWARDPQREWVIKTKRKTETERQSDCELSHGNILYEEDEIRLPMCVCVCVCVWAVFPSGSVTSHSRFTDKLFRIWFDCHSSVWTCRCCWTKISFSWNSDFLKFIYFFKSWWWCNGVWSVEPGWCGQFFNQLSVLCF